MKIQISTFFGAALAAAIAFGPVPASAQLFGGQQQQQGGMSAADAGLRINRLEEQIRQLNGRNEELMHQIRQFQEQIKRFQGDVDFRLQELEKGRGGGQRRGDAGGGASERTGQAATPAPSTNMGAAEQGQPAPGPRDLGQLPAGPDGRPLANGQLSDPRGGTEPGAPLIIAPEFMPQGPGTATLDQGPSGGRQGGGQQDGQTGSGQTGSQSGEEQRDSRLTAAPSASADDEYALASGFLQRRDYEFAEAQFKQFLSDHPSDRRTPDALYGLGESFYQRKQHNDAIEPFLTVVTKHPQSPRAADSMLRLGQTLAAIDQRDQACATLTEVGRKYPKSGARTQADNERKRLGC